ncbi:arylesterase [Ferrimonas gelatinilytica]|uniref:Arylesterase n=2 Tax=Ferrimonas gelatinilytica TaxID=1255257 RepID=A0ABP9RWM7_9GAMM
MGTARFWCVGLLFGLLLLSGCSKAPLPPLPSDGVILAFGDSLTAGVGAGPAQDYPSELARLTGLAVVNAGVSGELAQQGRLRLPEALARHRPDLLVLLMGGNDILRNRPEAAIKADLAAMIEQARGTGVPVLLVGVPSKRILLRTSPIYRELADQYGDGVVLVEDPLTELLRSPSHKSDAVHLNADGYRRLAQALHQRLIETGAL